MVSQIPSRIPGVQPFDLGFVVRVTQADCLARVRQRQKNFCFGCCHHTALQGEALD